MDQFTKDEIAKLPKWAAAKVTELLRELQRRESQLAEERQIASDNNPETRVRVAYRSLDGLRTLYLEEHETVEFRLTARAVRVSMDRECEKLRIESDGVVTIEPSAENCFRVTVKR
jgi:hypothetical protein